MLNRFRRNELLIILCVQVTLCVMGVGICSPILPQYAQQFSVSIAMVGLVITVFGVARLIADIPAGRLSTRFGCRPILISGPIIICVGSIGCGLANNYGILLAFRFIMGIGSAVLTTTSMIALIHMSTAQNRGQMMGFYQGFFLIGAGIGPAIGGFIAEYLGIQAPFFVYAGLAAVAALWGYYRLPRNLDMMQPEKPKLKVASDAQLHESANSKMGMKPLLNDLNFILVSTITFGIFFMRNAAQNQIVPLIGSIRLHLSEGQIGMAMTSAIVSQAVVIFTCSRLSDRYGRKAIITGGCVIVSVALIGIALSSNYLILILSSILGGIGVGIAGPAPSAYVADVIPRENYGVGMGLFRAVGDLGMVVGPVLLGWMSDTWSFNVALIFTCIFLLITVTIFQIFARATFFKTPSSIDSVD